jgi:alkylhydroperoxidase family enzyme
VTQGTPDFAVVSGGVASYFFFERDIWDIAVVAGFFNMSNRVASATDMRPNSVYHGQGR